jgi:RNA polymerase sigma factor (sigma-70 family)
MLGAFMERMNEPASSVAEPDVGTAPSSTEFEAFFRAEQPRLLRAMFVVTVSEQEAEELMQEAFLAVWERWDKVRLMDDPTGYLYRTAMNRFRSRWRRATRAARRSLRPAEARDAFADVDERDAVGRALRATTPRQRAALVLTEYLGFSSEEAGRILGVKDVTVRALASQGRGAMKAHLEAADG